jgi:hypothetical protein
MTYRSASAAAYRIGAARRAAWPGLLAAILVIAFGGLLAGGPSTPAAAAEPMSFRLASVGEGDGCRRSCADVIAADGEIDNETADRFVAFLSDHLQDRDLRPVVLIQSPGGTVVGAMQLGLVFRKIGAAVIVAAAHDIDGSNEISVGPGACLSACVYAFIGGKHRVVPPVSRLGIHRMVINEQVQNPSGGTETQRIYGSSDIVSSLAAYAKAMGVDPRVIGYAETISPDALHIVSPSEIARWRLGRPKL